MGADLHWQTKAALYRLFDSIPFGDEAYLFTQERVTKSVPRNPARTSEYIGYLDSHIEAFKRNNVELELSSYFEFGAGWDLFYPLGFAASGVKRLYVYDLTRLARARWVNSVLSSFRDGPSKHFARALPEIRSLKDLERIGLSYCAPADARQTDLDASSIDIVSTTSVLEHVPKDDLVKILAELKRICKRGALVSMLVDYEDHYGQRSDSAGAYNFLQYDAQEWKKFNPARHFQNRLRHKDYLSLFHESGFDLVEVETRRPDDWQAKLENLRISADFDGYTLDELSVTRGNFLLRA